MELVQYADVFKLLGDKNRLTIMALLKEKNYVYVKSLRFLQTSQPNISQHMRKLKDGGLVKEEKRGQWVYYSLHLDDKPFISEILEILPSQRERLNTMICEENECC